MTDVAVQGSIVETPILSLVVPCYNEDTVLSITARVLKQKLHELISRGKISVNSFIYFVDDGSSDATWDVIVNLNKGDHIFRGIKLSKNRGHQNAVLAGLLEAKNVADVVISLDADLQDDINAIDEMIDNYF